MNKKKFSLKDYASVVISVAVSFFFVAFTVYSATTITSNINTGGSLTVTGASTQTGLVTMAGGFVSQASSTAVSNLHVNGALSASSSLSIATTLSLDGLTADPPAADGLFYYNTTDNTLKMSDGTNWFGVGSTTSGLTKVGSRLEMTTLSSDFFTIGTSTAATSSHAILHTGISVLTLEATSTASVPLTLKASGWNNNLSTHVGNLFQVHNAKGGELFAIDALGYASGTLMTLSSGLTVSGSSTIDSSLTVSGAFVGSSTLQTTGAARFYDPVTFESGVGASSTVSITGSTTIAAAFNVGGTARFASAIDASSTLAAGRSTLGTTTISATASSTPTQELSVLGDVYIGGVTTGTTTLIIDGGESNSESFGAGCIQLRAADGTMVRLYASSTPPANGLGKDERSNGSSLVVEAGMCQTGN